MEETARKMGAGQLVNKRLMRSQGVTEQGMMSSKSTLSSPRAKSQKREVTHRYSVFSPVPFHFCRG